MQPQRNDETFSFPPWGTMETFQTVIATKVFHPLYKATTEKHARSNENESSRKMSKEQKSP